MTDEQREKAIEIAKKYNNRYSEFSKNATAREFTTVLKYVANEANMKQRKLAGLD
ncbi:MAG: hypothetical protein LBM27_04970 [Lactobacillaceae bacterium]|jgi:hypothetical protein|nr:hypothetical protein [Lactobacillaceae bacterium]